VSSARDTCTGVEKEEQPHQQSGGITQVLPECGEKREAPTN